MDGQSFELGPSPKPSYRPVEIQPINSDPSSSRPAQPQQPPKQHHHHHHHHDGHAHAEIAHRPVKDEEQRDDPRHPKGVPKPLGMTRSISRMGQNSMKMAGRTVSKLGVAVSKDRNKMLANMQARRQMMETSMKLLESNPTEANKKKAAKMKTFVLKQLEHREQGHPPYFTRCVTFVQLIIIACMMVFGKIAPWGFGVKSEDKTVKLFVGEGIQPMKTAKNPFFGPDTGTLVSWGSKWSPCMRNDEITAQYKQDTLASQASFGCCINPDNECGMMSASDCESYSSTFYANTTSCADQSCTITVRPCCFGIYGQCYVLTEDHCKAIDGSWDDEKELCDETQCLFRECGMGYNYYQSNPFGYVHPNQFYRFTTAIFLHVGVIHFVMNALGQYVLVAQVEFVAGFWRTAAMYVISGSCGFMISALFSAGLLSNGASAAIYGMLGVETVDLFQSWQLIENKCAQVSGLLVKLILFLGIGTLPFIDNFAHVGGFLSGVVVALCFLPYIVFGQFDHIRKVIVQILAVIFLIALVAGLLYKFYYDGKITCEFCKYIDCVPYTDSICDYESSSVRNSTSNS